MSFIGSRSTRNQSFKVILFNNWFKTNNKHNFNFSVKWLILDEADKLFEEGSNSFKKQFNQIYNACTHSSKTVALFSATWTNSVSKWCRKNLTDLITINIGQINAATSLVDQKLLFVGSEPGKLLAFRDMLRKGVQPPVLVFVDSKVGFLIFYFSLNSIFKINSHCSLGSSSTIVQRTNIRWH